MLVEISACQSFGIFIETQCTTMESENTQTKTAKFHYRWQQYQRTVNLLCGLPSPSLRLSNQGWSSLLYFFLCIPNFFLRASSRCSRPYSLPAPNFGIVSMSYADLKSLRLFSRPIFAYHINKRLYSYISYGTASTYILLSNSTWTSTPDSIFKN